MKRIKSYLFLLLLMATAIILFALVGGALVLLGWFIALLPLALLAFGYAWLLFAYLHYRQGRQDELLQILISAVESKTPLAPALRAFLSDRPSGAPREVWVAVLLFLVLPGYYWVWHRSRNYDRRVAALIKLLEEGVPLYYALHAVPGVVSRETLLAVAVGEVTGEMALCLRRSTSGGLASKWMEIFPRIVYPMIVVVVLLMVMSFLNLYILPKLNRIFKDLDATLPDITEKSLSLWQPLAQGVAIFFFLGLIGMGMLLFSSTIRWYFPFVGRIYRTELRGIVLRTMGTLLEAKTPAPKALALLADSGLFSRVVENCLDDCGSRVREGQPLAESLRRAGLMPSACVLLVQTAERAGNVPWALREIGESLSEQAVRQVCRLGMIASPLMLLGIGVMVGVVVIGMFLPLVKILEKLSV